MLTRTSLLLTLIWLHGVAAVDPLSAQELSTVLVGLTASTSVSDRFHRETMTATRSVPPQVWKTLEDAGWRLELAEFVVDAVPSLRGVRPRGWPRHLTWDNSDAISLPSDKLLVVAEKRRDRTGEIVASSRVAGVLRHELGHAFDMSAGGSGRYLSASAQFVQAYHQDNHRIAAEQRGALTYYLQADEVGLQETFAEAFAVVLGGGSSDIAPSEFETHFPRVTAYARAAIEEPGVSIAASNPTRVVPIRTVRRRLFRRR